MKERQYNLDIIRIIACLMIVNFHFLGMTDQQSNLLYINANCGTGIIYVTIFFLLTGFLLRMNARTISALEFYKKRFWSLYPCIFLMFPAFYLVKAVVSGDPFYGGSPWKLILSFLGIDAYLGWYGIATYHMIGEWFTAVILFVYLLYPLARKCGKRVPWLPPVVITILYVISFTVGIQHIVVDATVFTGMFVVMIGYYLHKYRKIFEDHRWVTMILSTIVYVVFLYVPTPVINNNRILAANLMGVAAFLFLYTLFFPVRKTNRFTRILAYVSALTYPIYLSHHRIYLWLTRVLSYEGLKNLAIDYVIGMLIIIVVSVVFMEVTRRLVRKFRR